MAAAGFEAVATSGDPEATEEMHHIETVPAMGATTARAVAGSAAVVIGGGTVFKDLHSSTGRTPGSLIRRTAALSASASAAGKPLCFAGVGAAPIRRRSSRRLARFSAKSADMLVLRDEESAAALRSAGVPEPFRIGADPAWTVLDARDESQACADGPLLVALSHFAGDSRTPVWLGEVLRGLCTEGMEVNLLPWQPADEAMAKEVARAAGGPAGPAELMATPEDLAQVCHLADASAAVLTLRFHGAVAAAAAGVPFVAVAHEPKLAAVARRMGMPAVRPLAPVETVAAAVREAIGRRLSPGPVQLERERATDTLRLLHLVLTGGEHWDDAAGSSLTLEPPPR